MKFLAIVMAALIIAGAGWLIFLLISAGDQTRLAVLTAAISVATLVYTQNRNSKREIAARHFAKKAEAYEDIVKLLTDFMSASSTSADLPESEMMPRIIELRSKLIIWAGPDVIKAWKAMEAQPSGANPFEALANGNKLLVSLRRELGHESDEQLGPLGIVSLFLKPGEVEKLEALPKS